MRLTLRTMLAFLDDVLEGPDAKELGQKIDESKFAGDLVHRIRSSVRRLRLGAPKVDGKGMGADANTVAEYLDNTMPSEHVPDFEKVCLESDVHLAEVAACHHVLTIVLGQPAAIEPAIRDRIYRIGHGEAAAPPPVSRDGNGSASARQAPVEPEPLPHSIPHPHPTPTPRPARPRHEESERSQLASVTRTIGVPTESNIPLKSLALTLLLGFVVAGVALRAIAPFNKNHPVWRLIAGTSQPREISQAPVVPSTASETKSTEVSPAAPTEPSATPPAPATSAESTTDSTAATTEPAVESATNAKETSPEKTGAETVPASPAAEIEKPTSPMPPSEKAAAPTQPTPTDPLPANIGATATVTPTPTTETKTPAKVPEVVAAPVNVGRYISEEQILARLDAGKSAWMVLSADTPLVADEQLMSLTTYRPQLVVAPSVKMTLAGEAFIRLHVPDATDVPHVTIDFGRALLIPVGEMGNTMQLDLGGRRGQLTFADAESAVAVEVRPYLSPGSDPGTAASMVVGQIWTMSGAAEWREPEREPLPLKAGQRGQFIDDDPIAVVAVDSMPDWIEGKNLTDIDRGASQELRKFLTTDRPLALSLMEQTSHRRVEVRALACRCLCYLDIFEPAIAALGDSRLKSYWHGQLAAIQSTLPFGPATVEKLRADIEKLHGEDAATVYRLLQGYSPEQLASGSDAELVDALENKSMTIRALGHLTLLRITDKTMQFYPDYRPEQEKSKVMRWRKMVEDKQIVYKTPPQPLPPIPPPNVE